MRGLTPFLSSLVSLLYMAGLAAAQEQTFIQPHSRIAQTIDENRSVTLSGNVHTLARSSSSTPVADETPMRHMMLSLKADATQEATLEELIAQQHDPKSPFYHKFLTPQAFGAQFGVAQDDLNKVTTWLEGHGFTIDEIPANHRSIVFSGTAGQLAQAFKTQIHAVTVAGVTHNANVNDPQIPAALADVVTGIVKLHDFKHTRSISTIAAIKPDAISNPQMDINGSHYLAPADYSTIYDITPLYNAGINGTGQTIAVLARSDISMTDVQTFRSYFGLPANNPQFVVTGNDPGVLDGDSTETSLDTEWAGATAPNANIKVIISASTSTADGIDLSAQYAVNNNVAPIITLSYGSCESSMGSAEMAFYNSLWKQAAAQGISVMVSAGDSGASCGPVRGINGLCSSAYSTCVGGTQFLDTSNPGQYWHPGNSSTGGSAISFIPEQVWNESGSNGGSGDWAGGGGQSLFFPKPSWQTGPGVPADGVRDVPDVSLTASGHDAYLIVQGGSLGAVGGTSASAPSFAGLMALVDQKMSARQGLANCVLYPLARNQAAGGPAVFHDTITGNNTVPGVAGFSATSGYDLASGLGSVDAAVMVNNWASGVIGGLSLSASSNTLTVDIGQTVQTTITSTPSATLKSAVTLNVAGAPSGITATLKSTTIASPGSGSVALSVAVGSSAKPGTYPITVTATAGTQTASDVLSIVVPTPTFTVSASSASLTAAVGKSSQVTISTTPQNGFASTLALSVTGLPAGVTAAFSPASLNGTSAASSTLNLSVASSAKAGTYSLVITAAGGGVTETAPVALVVLNPTFTFSASASSLNATAGKSASIVLTETPQSGFNSTVALSIAGLPAGVTAAFSPASLSGTGVATSTLGLTVATTAKAGSYPLVITASGGGVTLTASVSLVVTALASCSLGAAPNALSLTAGQSATIAVSCSSVQGSFTAPLALSVSTPGGFTTSGATTLTAGSFSNLAIATGATMAGGKYTVSVTASGSGFSQTISIPVTISVPSTFSLSAGSNNVTTKSGYPESVIVTSTPVAAFASAVSLNVTGLPAGVTAAFSKPVFAAPGSGSSAITFSASAIATAGNFTVNVVGTGGGITTSIPLTLTVAANQNFAFSVNTPAITVQQGGAPAPVVVSTGNFTGGFNSTIVISFSGLAPGMNYGFLSGNAANNMVNSTEGISAAPYTPPGTYPVTITASGAGIVHSAVVQVTVVAAAQSKK